MIEVCAIDAGPLGHTWVYVKALTEGGGQSGQEDQPCDYGTGSRAQSLQEDGWRLSSTTWAVSERVVNTY